MPEVSEQHGFVPKQVHQMASSHLLDLTFQKDTESFSDFLFVERPTFEFPFGVHKGLGAGGYVNRHGSRGRRIFRAEPFISDFHVGLVWGFEAVVCEVKGKVLCNHGTTNPSHLGVSVSFLGPPPNKKQRRRRFFFWLPKKGCHLQKRGTGKDQRLASCFQVGLIEIATRFLQSLTQAEFYWAAQTNQRTLSCFEVRTNSSAQYFYAMRPVPGLKDKDDPPSKNPQPE